VLLAALTPLLYFPAWVVAGLAAVLRRWRLAAVALVIVATHVWWTFPLVVGGPQPFSHPAVSTVLLTVNLNGHRHTGPAVSALIRTRRPGLVVLSEASPLSTAGLDLRSYPVAVTDIRPGTAGWAVLSTWPLIEQRRVSLGDRQMPRLVLRRPDGGRLILWQVHPTAPVPSRFADWRRQLKQIRAAIQADETSPDPVVVAGDFNATRDIPEFRRLLDDGWRDASDGHGLMATWPADGRLPPLLRLDHILVSPHIGVAKVARTPRIGSDHLGVLAELQFD
jgi:endonuclease/exonuclease/phosphatase (EEP) superfamily protein YafD